jgi:hypothetical protein
VEPENAIEPISETEAIQPKNFFSRLGGIYLSPKNTFQEISSSPRVLIPIIALIVIGFLLSFYIANTVDLQAASVRQMEKLVEQGRITSEQMELMLPGSEKVAAIRFLAGGAIANVIVALIIAGFAKLFSLFAGAQNRFKALFSVTAFTLIAISIIQTVLTILILHFKGSEDLNIQDPTSIVASNLGAVLENMLGEDALPKFAMGLAKAVDVFAIWKIVLLSIGCSAVSRKLKTSIAATWLAGTYTILAIIGAIVLSIWSR